MDPLDELPLNGTHEELAQEKINWLPGRREEVRESGLTGGKKKEKRKKAELRADKH